MPTNANEQGRPDPSIGRPLDDLNPVPFDALVSRTLLRIRAERGLSQHDLATIAREAGLSSWNRVVVANVERRARTVPLPELLLLLASLGESVERIAKDLLPDEEVELTPDAWATSDGLVALLRGKTRLADRDLQEQDRISTPRIRTLLDLSRDYIGLFREYASLWPGATGGQFMAARDDAMRAAEAKAAKELGVDPMAVSIAAHRQWGHGLTEEREVRVRSVAPADTPERALRVMGGQITRRLVEELKPLMSKAKSTRKGAS